MVFPCCHPPAACPRIRQFPSPDNLLRAPHLAPKSYTRRGAIVPCDFAACCGWIAAPEDRKVAAVPRALARSASECECHPSDTRACSPVPAEGQARHFSERDRFGSAKIRG